MKALLQLVLMPTLALCQEYRISKKKVVGTAIIASASLIDGVLEGYQFDQRRSFERKWNADPYGFWGSKSWTNKHTWYAKQMGVPDFYHFADDARKIGYVSGGIVLGIGSVKTNKKWWHYAADVGANILISSATKRVGLWWVRK